MSAQHRPIGCNIRNTPGGFVHKRKTCFQQTEVNRAATAFLAKRGIVGHASVFGMTQANARRATLALK